MTLCVCGERHVLKRGAINLSVLCLIIADYVEGQKCCRFDKSMFFFCQGLSGAKGRVSELAVLQFKKECQNALSKICKKALDKCPLKYATVHNMMCLNPRKMYSSPDECLQKLKRLIEKFVLDKQLTGGISSGKL